MKNRRVESGTDLQKRRHVLPVFRAGDLQEPRDPSKDLAQILVDGRADVIEH